MSRKRCFSALCLNVCLFRDPILVVDQQDRVCLALVGRPKQEDYKASALSVHETLLAERTTLGLTESATPSICGYFPAINVGAMHGKGTINPINLSTKGNEATVARLLKNPHVRKLAAFASCKFSWRVSTRRSKVVLLPFRFSVFIRAKALQGDERQTE